MSKARQLRIGLTGGIGSGKSTVAGMFSELGVPVLDLDRVGRKLTHSDTKCLQQLVAVFGEDILQPDGSLDRRALARRCFADAGETEKLNAVMHPLIRQEEDRWVNAQQTDYVIIEASVLIESGGAERMDAVIVVLADEELRLQRVLTRGDRSAEEFRAIVARQCGDGERRQVADYVIENSGGLIQLREGVHTVHQLLLSITQGVSNK